MTRWTCKPKDGFKLLSTSFLNEEIEGKRIMAKRKSWLCRIQIGVVNPLYSLCCGMIFDCLRFDFIQFMGLLEEEPLH
jgi:hypothetical protein